MTLIKSQRDEKEKEIVKKVKPKLQKWLIDKQVREARETAIRQQKEKDEQLNEIVIRRASLLSLISFKERKLFLEEMPPIEMGWIKRGLLTVADQNEQNIDIAGFATYLVKEYRNYALLKDNTKRGYLNPLDDKNLKYFWHKFCSDLRVLFSANSRFEAKGNKGIF